MAPARGSRGHGCQVQHVAWGPRSRAVMQATAVLGAPWGTSRPRRPPLPGLPNLHRWRPTPVPDDQQTTWHAGWVVVAGRSRAIGRPENARPLAGWLAAHPASRSGVDVGEGCRNRAGLARNGERDVREGDGPDKDLGLLRARALEGEVLNTERLRADVEAAPSLPRRELL